MPHPAASVISNPQSRFSSGFMYAGILVFSPSLSIFRAASSCTRASLLWLLMATRSLSARLPSSAAILRAYFRSPVVRRLLCGRAIISLLEKSGGSSEAPRASRGWLSMTTSSSSLSCSLLLSLSLPSGETGLWSLRPACRCPRRLRHRGGSRRLPSPPFLRRSASLGHCTLRVAAQASVSRFSSSAISSSVCSSGGAAAVPAGPSSSGSNVAVLGSASVSTAEGLRVSACWYSPIATPRPRRMSFFPSANVTCNPGIVAAYTRMPGVSYRHFERMDENCKASRHCIGPKGKLVLWTLL
ncbi:hypothetical protein GGS24DRAFT_475265, partial [Hypoxylon argillaceum]